MKNSVFILVAVAALFGCSTSNAQKSPPPGMPKIQIAGDQKLIFEADGHVVKRDYQGAESLYTQAIALNGGNTEAYLQRGFVRREMGNGAGAADDGRNAVGLANTALAANPGDANLYHERGMGFRLMRDFDHARADLQKAIQLSGQMSWQTDLQAMELEQKAGPVVGIGH